jgi:hypothetical protein
MNKLIKKILGIDRVENIIAQTEVTIREAEARTLESVKIAALAKQEAEEAKEKERLAKLGPKERATEKKEPWVAVLDTHVNKDNIRNGFFELDWNEYFVVQLRNAGYKGDTEEEVVDLWFQELCRNVGAESGVNMDRRGSGFINKALRDDGKTEVS